jgi:glutamate--cysteine ligase
LYSQIDKNLTTKIVQGLKHKLIGLEKENLRVSYDGNLAQTAHPQNLGAALTNPNITTDYSESMLEFITPPLKNAKLALEYLCMLHRYTYSKLDNEILWATSMPCVLIKEHKIPLALYGNSNLGMMKTVYRRGLGHRYGRVMQVISGIHFNYSFSMEFWQSYREHKNISKQSMTDFISDSYFNIIRNLQRVNWLLPYLFGASPAICKSFMFGIKNKRPKLKLFDQYTYYEPYATSLRMGDIGYKNNKDSNTKIKICYDNLDAYIKSIVNAMETTCPEYEKIGLFKDGKYQQLNYNFLQLEGEYYNSVRPKQLLHDCEKTSTALKKRGVKYIEIRSVDVNAFDPLGLSEEQIYFLEMLIIFCLFHDSPTISSIEEQEINYNQSIVAHNGRKPNLLLKRNGEKITLQNWAIQICNSMRKIAIKLDTVHNYDNTYLKALENQIAVIKDSNKTPSAKILAEMHNNDNSFHHFAKSISQEHHWHFDELNKKNPYDTKIFDKFDKIVENSWQEQKKIEQFNQNQSFQEYLKSFL